MNPLFYMGIVVPTVITIALFLIFIYCWLLQRARKEVLTRKYDPHGKMRSLGMSLNPPLPPSFCLLEELLLSDVGEDNVAYDVSRSPSTQADCHGRALYRTFHDSGISAGLSPPHESEHRHGLAYRTCPDSRISGLNLLQPTPAMSHINRGSHDADDVFQRQPQLQQECQDHIYLDRRQQQQYKHQSPDVALHAGRVQASVHLNRSVSSSSNRDGSVTSQSRDSPHSQANSLLDEYSQRHNSLHRPATPTSRTLQTSLLYDEVIEGHNSPQTGQPSFCSDQSRTLHCWNQQEGTCMRTEHHLPVDTVIMMSSSVNSHLQESLTLSSVQHLYDLPFPPPPPLPPPPPPRPPPQLVPSSFDTATAAIPPNQFYRDSSVMGIGLPTVLDPGIIDLGQITLSGIERPDSQASQSSSTDSEDSGFRSSYCAAHRKDVLGKQEHPLLKPLRRSTRNKNHRKSSRRTTCPSQKLPFATRQPVTTSSPTHQQDDVHNVSVIKQANSRLDVTHKPLDVIHRPLPLRQQGTNLTGRRLTKGDYCAATSGEQAVSENSPTSPQCSPARNIWALHSSNDGEVSATQTISLTHINTQPSRAYLPGVGKPTSHLPDHSRFMQPSGQACPPDPAGQPPTDGRLDSHMYSVV